MDRAQKAAADRLRGEVAREIRIERRRRVRTSLDEHRNNPRKFWQSLNDLLGKNLKDKTSIHLKDSQGQDVPHDSTSNFINKFYGKICENLAKEFNGIAGDLSMNTERANSYSDRSY